MPDSEPLGGDLIGPDWTPSAIDPTVATPARIYSYLLGGGDHFPADREAAEKALEAMPELRDFARVNRAFLTRAVRHLAEILENPEVRGRLDFDRPVAVLLVAVMHFVIDEDDPYGAVGALMDAVAPGSVLVLSQVTADLDPEGVRATAKAYARSSVKTAVRSGKEIAAFFDGLEPVDPGLVMLSQWRPDEQVLAGDDRIGIYGGVALKP